MQIKLSAELVMVHKLGICVKGRRVIFLHYHFLTKNTLFHDENVSHPGRIG